MDADMCRVVAKRMRLPMKQHHISVFTNAIRLSNKFSGKWNLTAGDHLLFTVSGEGTVRMLAFRDMVAIRMASLNRKYGSKGYTTLSIWSESTCEMLRGAFLPFLLPYNKLTRSRPSLRLRAEFEDDREGFMVFRITPAYDLEYISQVRKKLEYEEPSARN